MNTHLNRFFLLLFLLMGSIFISANAQRHHDGDGGRSNEGRNFNGGSNRQRSFGQSQVFNRQNNNSFERRDQRRNNFPAQNRVFDIRRNGNDDVYQRRGINRDIARSTVLGSPRNNRTVNNIRINNNSRYGYGYDRSDHYNRYNYVPRRYVYMGAPRFSILPRTYVSIRFGGYPYYYYGGGFYSYFDGFYEPVFAPIGIHIRILPVGYYPIYVGPHLYYYYNGIYYNRYNDEYQVVDAPIGAEVSVLPKGARVVTVNGEKFYEFNGTYYKEGVNTKNEVVYTVVGKYGEINNTDSQTASSGQSLQSLQIGDEINTLPQNTRQVTINGESFFVTPDNLYLKAETKNNAITYKVVGTVDNQ